MSRFKQIKDPSNNPKLEKLPQKDLLDLERLQVAISRINLEYCKDLGLKEVVQKIPIRRLFDDSNYLEDQASAQ